MSEYLLTEFTKNTCFKCIGCGAEFNILQERSFKCTVCGNIFDVKHTFGKREREAWIYLFNNRRQLVDNKPQFSSGVWRFKEWIMPYLPEEYIVSRHEGNVRIAPAGPNLRKWLGGDIYPYIIFEGDNPSGSFKDMGMTVLASVGKAAGAKLFVCSSTGDTSAALSRYAAIAGIPCAVILPGAKGSEVTAVQMHQPMIYGAKTFIVPGVFDDAMTTVEDLVENYGGYLANSKNASRIEGHQATVFLLAQYFDWSLPDVIAAPVGNGSNLSSLGKGIATMKLHGFEANAMVLGCQVEGVNPAAGSWEFFGKRHVYLKEWQEVYKPIPKEQLAITASTAARIGDPVSIRKVMRSVIDTSGGMITCSEAEQNEAVRVAGRDGDDVCPQTGMALAGVKRAIMKGLILPGQTVAIVSTATGLKFPGAVTGAIKDSAVITVEDCKASTIAKHLGL